MENITDLSKIPKVDELSVRKVYIEAMLKEAKSQTKDKVMLILGGAFVDDIQSKTEGMVVFLERWLGDIDKEINNL